MKRTNIRHMLLPLLLIAALFFGTVNVSASPVDGILGWLKGITGNRVEKEVPDADDIPDNKSYYEKLKIDEDGTYDTKDEVCAYLVQYKKLPSNFMTKKEAKAEGWEGGALNSVIPGKCIGGDVFKNYDGNLPEAEGRVYHECDIDTLNGSKRGAKRIIYSGDDDAGDWNIYYTDDHYETFTLLWGDDQQ